MINSGPPIVDRRVRFALVGYGGISKNQVGAIAAHSERLERAAQAASLPTHPYMPANTTAAIVAAGKAAFGRSSQ